MIYWSSKTRESKAAEFHMAMGLDLDAQARVSLLKLRKKLILEEVREFIEASDKLEMELERGRKISVEDWENYLKELVDVQYVVSGTVISFNTISSAFDVAFNRVHLSNMSKLDDDGNPVLRSDGKVVKGPNYKPPVLSDLIKV